MSRGIPTQDPAMMIRIAHGAVHIATAVARGIRANDPLALQVAIQRSFCPMCGERDCNEDCLTLSAEETRSDRAVWESLDH